MRLDGAAKKSVSVAEDESFSEEDVKLSSEVDLVITFVKTCLCFLQSLVSGFNSSENKQHFITEWLLLVYFTVRYGVYRIVKNGKYMMVLSYFLYIVSIKKSRYLITLDFNSPKMKQR